MTTLFNEVPRLGQREPALTLLTKPLVDFAQSYDGQRLNRAQLHQLLRAGAVSAQAADEMVNHADDLQGLLAGLAPNTLPDDSEVYFFLRQRRQAEHHVKVTCKFKDPTLWETEAVLDIECHYGWGWRPHSLTAGRVLPRTQALPLRLPR